MSSILACTDGSLYAPSIYQHAAWAAERTRTSIQVVHFIERRELPRIHDLSGSIGFDANAELLEELARADENHARLARLRGDAILADAAKQLAGVPTTVSQRHGSLVESLEELEKSASLIVIGKRGENADFAKGHIGSNLERVVRSAHIPVLVAARAFRPIRRCLIAFDGGESSLKAVQHAASDPLLSGLECHLLAIGKPDGELVEPAEEVRQREIDLLVMGAYGHSRVRQFILGSTTTALLRTCLVPVLLFR